MYDGQIKLNVLDMLSKKSSVKEVSEYYNISPSTIYSWKKDEKFISKFIKEKIKNQKFREALVLADQYPDNNVIVSQLITCYLKLEKNDIAKEIAFDMVINKKTKNKAIKSQLMKCYISLKEYDNAYLFFLENTNDLYIKSQMIQCYISQRKFKEALEIINDGEITEIIKSQLMTIYIEINKFDEAIEFAKNNPDNEIIQNKLLYCYKKQKKYLNKLKEKNKDYNENKLQNTFVERNFTVEDEYVILEKIKNKTVTYDELEESIKDLNSLSKIIFKCAYLENSNKSMKTDMIKKLNYLKKNGNITDNEKKIINECVNLLGRNTVYFFDISLYFSLIDRVNNIKTENEYKQR